MLTAMCKIAIIENYALFGYGIKSLLESQKEFEVIGEGANTESLTKRLNGKIPDLILIDMLHCFNAGIKLIKRTRKVFPKIPLLLVTSEDFSDCFNDYVFFGARGFVFKNDSPENLIAAVKNIYNGKSYFLKESKKFFKDAKPFRNSGKIVIIQNSNLTEREIEILKLFCDGYTYREIGLKLFISPRTVESHKENILAKLQLNSKAEMIKYATRNKLTG